MQTLIWNNLTQEEKRQALARPAQKVGESIKQAVDAIRENVTQNGDNALFELCEKFDKVKLTSLVVSPEQIAATSARISPALAQAIQQAKANIEAFHKAQQNQEIDIETQAGVRCQVVTRPISRVGLYIPGGSAPLFSTVLMLAIPAKIAGCKKKLCCAPHHQLPMKFFTPHNYVAWKPFMRWAVHKPFLLWHKAPKQWLRSIKFLARVMPL